MRTNVGVCGKREKLMSKGMKNIKKGEILFSG
jgi:hypothetical protein